MIAWVYIWVYIGCTFLARVYKVRQVSIKTNNGKLNEKGQQLGLLLETGRAEWPPMGTHSRGLLGARRNPCLAPPWRQILKNMPKKQNGKKNHCQNRRRNDEVQASRKVAAYAAAYLAIASKSHIRVRHAHILAFGAACVKQKKRKKCQM